MRLKLSSLLLTLFSLQVESANSNNNNNNQSLANSSNNSNFPFPLPPPPSQSQHQSQLNYFQTLPNQCQNVYRYPKNCHNAECMYSLVWRLKPDEDSIEFLITSKYSQRWTGIGFSKDGSLQNVDAIFAWIEDNSRYVMMDAFLPTYTQPISDKQQSISNISATVTNGRISFKFQRKRNTLDSQEDLVLSDERCVYLIYPVKGGTVDTKNRTVLTHEFAPEISDQPICIRSCQYKPPAAATTQPVSGGANNSTHSSTTTTALGSPSIHFPSPSARPNLNRNPSSSSSSSSSTLAPPVAATTSHRPRVVPTTSSTSTTLAPSTSSSSPPTSSSTTSTSTSTTTSTTTTTTPEPPTSTTTEAPQPSTTTRAPTSSTSTTTTSTTTTTTTTPAPTTTPPQQIVTNNKQEQSSAPTTAADLSASSNQISEQQEQWCVGRWSHPPGCRFQAQSAAGLAALRYLEQPIDSDTSIRPLPLDQSDCSYFAQWQYLEPTDSIEFIIQTKTRLKWTGIGFSNSTRMANSDAIIGLIEERDGRHFIMDTWLKDHVMPELDDHQNTEMTWGKRENGTTTVKFRRKRITGDPYDFQFTDNSCAYFFFPTQGGSFNAISKRLHKHEVVPSVSKKRICVRSCSNGQQQTSSINSNSDSSSSSSINSSTQVASSQQQQQPIQHPHMTNHPNVDQTSSSSVMVIASSSDQQNSLSSSSSSSQQATAQPPPNQQMPTTTSSSVAVTTTTTSSAQGVNNINNNNNNLGQSSTLAPAEKSPDGNGNINAVSSNDLNVELDSSSSTSASSSASAGVLLNNVGGNSQLGGTQPSNNLNNINSNTNNLSNKLAFLSEPSLRWLAGIGCVATLMAMIVFQACFTLYKNKQAYKQNIYRQSAFKQNAAYLSGAYLTDTSVPSATATATTPAAAHMVSHHHPHHQATTVGLHHPHHHHHHHHQASSTGSSEETQTASLHNSGSNKISASGGGTASASTGNSATTLVSASSSHHHQQAIRSRPSNHTTTTTASQHHHHLHHHHHPHQQRNESGGGGGHYASSSAAGPYVVPMRGQPGGGMIGPYDQFVTTESSEPDEEEGMEEEEDDVDGDMGEELEEVDDEEEYDDDMMIDPNHPFHHDQYLQPNAHHHQANLSHRAAAYNRGQRAHHSQGVYRHGIHHPGGAPLSPPHHSQQHLAYHQQRSAIAAVPANHLGHYRAAGHHLPSAQTHQASSAAALHRAHLPNRSQLPHQHHQQHYPNSTNSTSRPDSYFLPSQRRY